MKRTTLLLNETKNNIKKQARAAVSIVPFFKITQEDYEVLLIKRKNEPDKGRWSVPGGSIEFGEFAKNAIQRELYEETNINPTEYELKDTFEISEAIKFNEKNEVLYHYVILQFIALLKGEPLNMKAGDDAEEIVRVTKKEIHYYAQNMTHNLLQVIEKAYEKVKTGM